MTFLRPNGSMFRTLGLALLLVGCTAGEEDVSPPQYDLYFPTGLALSPDEHFLFVLNANADLRYDSGTIQVVDLDQVDQLVTGWSGGQAPADCAKIPGQERVLSCPMTKADTSPEPWVVSGATVKVGSFGAALAVEPMKHAGQPSSVTRVFATIRGDPSVTFMDFDSSARTMSCGETGDFPKCNQANRLARFRNDPTLSAMPPEPFYLDIDPGLQLGYVTHLSTGVVSLFSAPNDDTQQPELLNFISTLFGPSLTNGALSAVGIASRTPGDPNGFIYVTSRQEARIATLTVARGTPLPDGTPVVDLVRGPSFFYSGIVVSGLQQDSRSIAFSPDGNRAYVINRTPPSLVMIDTSLDVWGTPKNTVIGMAEVCAQPAEMALTDFGEGMRVVVPCFAAGQTWVFDANTLDLLVTEDSGRGPDGVVASARRKKIYVANYAEDTIAVMDAAPGSPTQFRQVVRLGTARVVPVTR